jgi:hypothetical protein
MSGRVGIDGGPLLATGSPPNTCLESARKEASPEPSRMKDGNRHTQGADFLGQRPPRRARSDANCVREIEGRVARGSEPRRIEPRLGPAEWAFHPREVKAASCWAFSRGERSESNPRPPAPQRDTADSARVAFGYVEPNGVGQVSPVAQLGTTIGTPARVQCANDAPSQTIASDPMKTRPSSACSCGRRMCQTTRAATTATSASLTWSVPVPH